MNLVDCFKTSCLIILFTRLQSVPRLQFVRELGQFFNDLSSDHPFHPSPVGMWTLSIVLRPLIWSSSLLVSRKYVNLVNCFKTYDLIILFIRLQNVCELGQLFQDLSSDHHDPLHPSPGSMWTWSIFLIRPLIWSSSSPISSGYVNLVNCFKTSHLSSSSPVSRLYVNLVNCFKTSHLIILFACLQEVRELCQMF